VSTCCSAYGGVADRQFDAAKVALELRQYRKKGSGPTTGLLRDGLAAASVVSGSLLDIGAGIGALTFDLLDRGCTSAVAVDASSAYLMAAVEEATRRDRVGRIQFVKGDFVELAPTLDRADVVALDRVVCCYPFVERLLVPAIGHAGRAIALSYPRDVWYVRAVLEFDNLRRRLTGNSFRTFVHSPALMERLILGAGFRLSSRRKTWTWTADVFVRTPP
jgi:magnesium-protoporphyrin O-methyltransferase